MKVTPRAIARAVQNRIRRILPARFRASIRSSDVFLVTYPRSGTTWLGFLLANVLKADLLDQLNIRTFVKYVPEINEEYFERGSLRAYHELADPRIFLVHAQYDPALSKVVYLLRDPRDVMVSYWHFRRLTESKFNLTLREFIESNDHWPCRWDEHVAGWMLQHKHPNLLVVRYEEMRRDTMGVLTRILDFSGISPTKDSIEKAVHASRLENMKELETQFGFALNGAMGLQGERFVRKGQVGSWKDELDETCLRILENKYSPVMGMVGYKPITK
jgi:sulfotransferase family protein